MQHRAVPILMAAVLGLASLGADIDAVHPASGSIGFYSYRANVRSQTSSMNTDGSWLVRTAPPVNAQYYSFDPYRRMIGLASAGQFMCRPHPRVVSTHVSVQIGLGSPARILLTDPRGRLAGTEFGTGKGVADIPTSTFFESEYPSIIIEKAVQGKYTLDVLGMGSGGRFELDIAYPNAFPNGFDLTEERFFGTMAPGQKLRFTFDVFAFKDVTNLFAAFSARLETNSTPLKALETNSASAFTMNSTFTLCPRGEIAPATEPLAIQLGDGFLIVIPPGSFHPGANGARFFFKGTINGVALEGSLTLTGRNSYALRITGNGARNLPVINPVEVRLGIGNNGGSVSVDAQFVR